jgi:PiT family inorganic phosphate transporter
MSKHKVDGDLKKILGFMAGARKQRKAQASMGLSVLFLVSVLLYVTFADGAAGSGMFVIAAAVVGAYMAMKIGAFDVVSNMGPAVGTRTLTMVGALCIAAVFEAAGVLIAGDDVVSTISNGIIDSAGVADHMMFIWAMMSAVLAASLWLSLATWVGAPASTTHSIVGGVIGAAIAAAGAASVAWSQLLIIAASWVISPLLGGIIAAATLLFIKKTILDRADLLEASRTWLPILVGIMAGAFSMYLMMKGLQKKWTPEPAMQWLVASGVFAVAWALTKPLVAQASRGLDNRSRSVTKLFTVPLICSAALLSFAHGSNDVASVIGPLAAIVSVAGHASVDGSMIVLPLWVMVIGAVGIALGLLLFSPKLIKAAGEKFTKFNQMRAFCVAFSAAITVIAASWFGLPVSSIYIAVGGVFGVGFLREVTANRAAKKREEAETVKAQKKREKRKFVRRREMLTIVTAWVITVPIVGLLSASLYFLLSGVFGG